MLVVINQLRNGGKAMLVGEKELIVRVLLDVIMFHHSIFDAAAQKKQEDFKHFMQITLVHIFQIQIIESQINHQ